MAQSVPQDELDSMFGGIVFAGLALASQSRSETMGGRVAGPVGSEVWLSDNGATNHITNNATKVYD